MKIKIILCYILPCFFVPDMFAQVLFSTGPVHPLVNYGVIRTDTSIDTIHMNIYSESGPGREMTLMPVTGIYRRSEDNLTDTVTTFSGLINHRIFRYNEKNQCLFWREYNPHYPLMQHSRTDFEYDDEGRLNKIVIDYVWPDGVPEQDPPVDTTKTVFTYDYSTVQKTEKGYIFNGIEYEFDYKGRLTYQNAVDAKVEMIEYTDGTKYRMGATYYTYTDSSCTAFGCYQPGDMVLGMPDVWVETAYVFDSNENMKLKTVRVSHGGVNWILHELTTWEYVYSSAGENPVHTPPAAQTGTTVYAHSGAIHIVAENAALTRIFDMFGRLIKQQTVSPGENRIDISSTGFYIVTVSNESFKVFIK